VNQEHGQSEVELSVVIPVYNSSDSLPHLLEQLTRQLEELGRRYEVILVDDDSADRSWEVIKELAPEHPHLLAVRLMRNSGQAGATLCGLARARGEIVVTMDDDLQHPPDQLPKLLRTLETQPQIDCVFGCFAKKRHAAYRNLGSRILHWVNARAFGFPKDLRPSSFRAMRRSLALAILQHRSASPVILALVCRSTRRISSVRVDHAQRRAGKSNYSLSKQIRLALDDICNVSMLPLRVVSAVGAATCLLGVLLVAVVLLRYALGQITVPGWTTVVILVSFFSGIILLSLGIIGEYLARVLREVQGAAGELERERIDCRVHPKDTTAHRTD